MNEKTKNVLLAMAFLAIIGMFVVGTLIGCALP